MALPRLQEQYQKKIIPELKKALGTANVHAVPHLTKVVLNVGIGKASSDPKLTENVISTLVRITGQKPVVTKARKSISNFKIRQGMGVGVMVTLRGRRMYEFVDKLVNVSLPRVRDFQGLKPTAFDASGNYTLALKEHLVFPEISSDSLEAPHGLEVTVCTSAKNADDARMLLQHLGFPFRT